MWWLDAEPYPGPDFEDDFYIERHDGQLYRFPNRDNEVLFTLPAGYRPRSIKPGEMYVKDGQPMGVVRSVEFRHSGPVSVIVQVSTY